MAQSNYKSTETEWYYQRNGIRQGNRKLKRIVIAILFLILVVAGAALWVGSSLVASANRDIGSPPSDLPIESLTLESESGARIATWQIKSSNSKGTVLLLHPLRGSRNSMLHHAYLFHGAGYSVVSIDMQAHGESRGSSITMGHLESKDVVAALDHIQKTFPDDKVVVVGNSLGGAAALLADMSDVDAVVLESVYPSITQAISNRVSSRIGPLSYVATPLLTLQLKPRLGVSPDELMPINGIRELDCPVLILAGQHDPYTTIQESQEMFDAAQEPKQMEVFERAKHKDLFKYAPEFYEEKVLGFLEKHISQNHSEKMTSANAGTKSAEN